MKRVKKYNMPTVVVRIIIAFAVFVNFVLYFALGWQKICYDYNYFLDATIKSVATIYLAIAIERGFKLVVSFMRFKTQRGRTLSVLTKSVVKYLIAILSLILVLIYYLGNNYISELFTGIGVLALIIGLGCQSLISDIVAGLFMVFEGNYEVGDVVVINGWRGTVAEIGLRTTVIEDVGGNRKIVNNSNISEIINNSQDFSYASITVGIEYDEKLERVEKVIADNISNMKKEIPEIIDGPFYKGVDSLGDSSVVLKIVAKCKEEDKFQVQRDLNRQIKLLFDRNDINIPFPQVTLSNRVANNKSVNEEEKKEADKFVRKEHKYLKGESENQ